MKSDDEKNDRCSANVFSCGRSTLAADLAKGAFEDSIGFYAHEKAFEPCLMQLFYKLFVVSI